MRLFPLMALLTATLALPALVAPAHAEPPVAPEGMLTKVAVRGNKRIEEDSVLQRVGLRKGDRITPAAVRRDIKSVWETGFFEDVRVEVEPDGDGIALVFVVKENPAVADVRIAGSKKVQEEDIKEVIDITPFAVLNDAEVKANVDRIRDLYVGKGYYLAEISTETTFITEDEVDLTFRIQENKKVIVQDIDITGNDHVPDPKIRRFLQLKQGGIVPWLTNAGTFKKDLLDSDREIVRQVYLEEGYVNASVAAPKVYLSPDKKFIFITYDVEEGEKYTVGQVNVEGDFVPEEGLTEANVRQIAAGRPVVDIQDELWRTATNKRSPKLRIRGKGPHVTSGQPFKLSDVVAVAGAISDFYGDQGYAFVNVGPMPDTDDANRTVDIVYSIEKGEKVRIGRINISGNDPTFDKVIRRELLVDEGDLYRGGRIKASKAQIERRGYFESVEMSTPRGEGENTLDLDIKVAEQPTGSFSLGFGFSSLEQFMLTANVSKNNFLGLGYSMSAMINWSSINRQWQLQFADPYFLDSRWTFAINGYDVTRRLQLDEYQRGGSIEIGRYLDRRDDLRVSVDYTFEDVGLQSLDPYRKKTLGGDLFRNGITSTIGASISLDKRNNRIKATRGVVANAAVSLSGGFRLDDKRVLSLLGGGFNFVEARLNFRFYQPIIPKSDWLVFRFNTSAAWMFSTDGRVIPFIHRYRAGGIDSLRGFYPYSLGPSIRSPESDDPIHADDTLIVGGTESWITNIEIESPIVKQAGIAAVVFFDLGNVFGDPWGNGHIDPADFRLDYGAGIRWTSPIGPLRFEYGIPIKPREGEKHGVFQFNIGSFF